MRYLLMLAVAAGAWGQMFEGSGDIGETPQMGRLALGPPVRVTGGGANVWGTADALFFAWKRVRGDVTISADVEFVGTGRNAHRKAMLMIRQDLLPGAVYADVALHGDGLTALQYRESAGGVTRELRSEVKGPVRIQIERRGNQIRIGAGKPGALVFTGPQTVVFDGPVYAGLGVCSHDAAVLETAVFSNVRIEQPPQYRSLVTVYDLGTKQTRTVHTYDGVMEAPNWSRDGRFLLVNAGGDLYRLPVGGGLLEKIELAGGTYRCNNDHDLSRDGKRLGFSASTPASRQSQVFVADADGKNVKLLTPAAPSYFHGWSPDGRWLAFVGQRGGKYELFRVGMDGGAEERLTSRGAYDDGPEYSPDGKWIYFNSNRSGGWDVWRIPAGGGGPGDARAERVTTDAGEDWFPHISPDGKKMLFLSFPAGTEGHNGRMAGMQLRLMAAPGRRLKASTPQVLTTFFGGQGTINVNSWAPDSKQFAFVIYEPVPAR
jgi:Tol biopolymer transport system component